MVGIATALVILGGSIAPFLTPQYVRFEQDRTGVAGLTGYSPAVLDGAVGQILGDLVLWRGAFDTQVETGPIQGPVLTAPERAHMLDVRNVFTTLWVLVVASLVVLVIAFRRAKEPEARARMWRSARNGAVALTVVIAIAGVFAIAAFDAAFELFHRLFFSAGTYTFDPATSKLVQLFPDDFWSQTAIVVGLAIIVVAILTAVVTGRRARRAQAAA